MLEESALRIEVHRKAQVEVVDVQAERALVGSGAHCDVRLAPDEGAVEQLVVEVRSGEVFVTVRAFEPPCRLNGAPLLEGRLPPEALVEFGGVALRAQLTELEQGPKQAEKPKNQSSPAVQALGLFGLAVGFYLVLNKPPAPETAMQSRARPPTLFADEKQDCPHTDLEAARSSADQDYLDADNKRERSPFHPRDGLMAVLLYARAAACYERADQTQAAREAREAAATLKARMSDEFHVRQVRIERFIAQAKLDELRREVRLAAEFVEDPSHPYAHWLSALGREAEVRASAKDRRKR